MSLSTAAITAGIAALNVAGVTIRNIDEIPDQVQGRDCPMLYPHPDSFMQGGAGAGGEGLETFGTPTSRFWLFNRTFRYVYLHCPVGTGRSLSEQYAAMLANVDAILVALTALDVADKDVMSIGLGAIGVLEDASGSKFIGFTLDVSIREKVNP